MICKLFHYHSWASSVCSNYHIVAMAVDRVVALKAPFWHREHSSKHLARKISLACSLFCYALVTPNLYFFGTDNLQVTNMNVPGPPSAGDDQIRGETGNKLNNKSSYNPPPPHAQRSGKIFKFKCAQCLRVSLDEKKNKTGTSQVGAISKAQIKPKGGLFSPVRFCRPRLKSKKPKGGHFGIT